MGFFLFINLHRIIKAKKKMKIHIIMPLQIKKMKFLRVLAPMASTPRAFQ